MRSFVLCGVLGLTACAGTGGARAPVDPAPATAVLEPATCWRSFEDLNDPVCPVQGVLTEEERMTLAGPAEATAVADDVL